MQFKVKKYTDSERSIWNGFLIKCKNTHFMFHRDFMEYHSDRFKDFSLIITDEKDNVVTLIPGNESNQVFYSHQGLTFGGFLMDKNIHAKALIDIFDEFKSFLKKSNFNKIIYKPIPTIYHQYPAQEDLYALFRNDAQLHRRDISSSILIEDRYQYSKGKRSGINKAKREGVICMEVEKPSHVWHLIREVLAEYHEVNPVHNELEIDYLKNRFPNNIKAYAAFHKEKIVSACVTFETTDVVHTQYLASSRMGRDIRALDMLIDYVICESSTYAKVFDFGISNENNGKHLNSGLIHQKESFGARAIVYDLYSVDLQ